MAIRKAIIKYEVIYDTDDIDSELLSGMSLADIHQITVIGGASGRFLDSEDTELTPEEAYDALEEQGSDPSFMGIIKCDSCELIFQSDVVGQDLCPECSN